MYLFRGFGLLCKLMCATEAGACRDQRSLGHKLQVAVNCPMRVLGSKLAFPAREEPFLQPQVSIFEKFPEMCA